MLCCACFLLVGETLTEFFFGILPLVYGKTRVTSDEWHHHLTQMRGSDSLETSWWKYTLFGYGFQQLFSVSKHMITKDRLTEIRMCSQQYKYVYDCICTLHALNISNLRKYAHAQLAAKQVYFWFFAVHDETIHWPRESASWDETWNITT